jgi:hypothetical protein
LNDPFVHEKSESWAARLITAQSDEMERIRSAWRTGIGRLPTDEELTDAAMFLKAYRSELTSQKIDKIELRSLAAYLRTILGSNAFLYVD